MTEQKVTSYELSKKLSECGFESETHTGFYNAYTKQYSETSRGIPKYLRIKAYDTWDLLMWFVRWKVAQGIAHRINLGIYRPGFQTLPFELDYFNFSEVGNEPQDALAMAIIKILEEEKKC
jgi:hypothetical protein